MAPVKGTKRGHPRRYRFVRHHDRGAGKVIGGKADETRVLDLSRAAMAYLVGKTVETITDSNAGVIWLTMIEVVSKDIPLGPVKS